MDWKLFKETLSHIILVCIKAAGKVGKVHITLSYHSIVDCCSINDE